MSAGRIINEMMQVLEDRYTVREKENLVLKIKGMKFVIRSYNAEGFGHVSTMEASGFFGLMKMDTLIINPLNIDMPLLSYDRVLAMGNDTLIYEIYDTLIETNSLSSLEAAKDSGKGLPDHDLGAHWYDDIKLPVSLSKKGRKVTSEFDALAEEYFRAYLDDCGASQPADEMAKREKASFYVEGLLKHGGPSTDVFIKALGDERTGDLFRHVLFGTENR